MLLQDIKTAQIWDSKIVIKEFIDQDKKNLGSMYFYCKIRKIESSNVVCVWIYAMSYDDQKYYSIPHTLSWFNIDKVIRMDSNLEHNTTIPMIVGIA